MVSIALCLHKGIRFLLKHLTTNINAFLTCFALTTLERGMSHFHSAATSNDCIKSVGYITFVIVHGYFRVIQKY